MMIAQSIVILLFYSYLTIAASFSLFQNEHISPQLYLNLSTYAHLIDISYCISPLSKIEPPFQCDNSCDQFNNTEIIIQWTPNDLNPFNPLNNLPSQEFKNLITTGYIALMHDWKTILVVIRGTRSFKDSMIDVDADMIPISMGSRCLNCKVHRGFYKYYQNTWSRISDALNLQIIQHEDYKILIMGHSLGGAISLLLSLKISLLIQNSDRVKCVTMGQPKVGNKFFCDYVDEVFAAGSIYPFENATLVRVTKKKDPIVQLPWSSNDYLITEKYSHSSNEIFIDEIGAQKPSIQNVVFCHGNDDVKCMQGEGFSRNNAEHLNYFRVMGKCGFGFI